MTAYYNENDPHSATWLENLIAARLIAPGIVDRRSIVDVRASDLVGFDQCHFFAGIGGWSCALRIAGWEDKRRAWTISCPCQPWSKAHLGGGQGEADDRDLWPVMFELIRRRKPSSIFGEQVYQGIAARWIERTRKNLKDIDYKFHAERRKAWHYGSSQTRTRFYFSAHTGRAGGERLVSGTDIGILRPWRWRGEKDLQAIVASPFEPGNRWPKPLLRRGDDGVSRRMDRLRAYGNAIDPYVAAQFISETRKASF